MGPTNILAQNKSKKTSILEIYKKPKVSFTSTGTSYFFEILGFTVCEK